MKKTAILIPFFNIPKEIYSIGDIKIKSADFLDDDGVKWEDAIKEYESYGLKVR